MRKDSFRWEVIRRATLSNKLIDGQIDLLRKQIISIEEGLKQAIIMRIVIIGLLIGALLGAVWAVMLHNIIIGVAVGLITLVSTSLTIFAPQTNRFCRKRLFAKQYISDIEECESDIDSIERQARNIQTALEPNDSPGFLSIYSDVFTDRQYDSEFTMDDRACYAVLSENGQGDEIPLIDYHKVLDELKRSSTRYYINPLVDNVRYQVSEGLVVDLAQSVVNFVLKTPREYRKNDGSQLSITGRHYWSYLKRNGLPADWSASEHTRFELAGDLFKIDLHNTDELAACKELVEKYRELNTKIESKKQKKAG